MIPTLITNEFDILKLQLRLEGELKKRGERFNSNYQTRGLPEGMEHDAYYFKEYNIYWKSGDYSKENRYWNTFGVGRPEHLRDAFQVNVPKKGINRRVSGGFLQNDSGTLLLHRGSLGGGRKDGKHDIRDMAPDAVKLFDDAGRKSKGILFPFLDAAMSFHPEFLPRVAEIVKVVARRLGRE